MNWTREQANWWTIDAMGNDAIGELANLNFLKTCCKSFYRTGFWDGERDTIESIHEAMA